MKKTYILEELDCANCAAKMQESIKKISGVNDCSITFMTKKMVLDAQDENFDRIFKEVEKAISKVEPDVEVVPA
ncbi:MAG: cation transporter [Lachnospiraceae bacterium]|nr:cation transporter [Lachnospiraceae bacterium]